MSLVELLTSPDFQEDGIAADVLAKRQQPSSSTKRTSPADRATTRTRLDANTNGDNGTYCPPVDEAVPVADRYFLPCQICGLDGEDEDGIMCDLCNGAFHLSCLELSQVPEGEWYCASCTSAMEPTSNGRSPSASKRKSRPPQRVVLPPQEVENGDATAGAAAAAGEDNEEEEDEGRPRKRGSSSALPPIPPAPKVPIPADERVKMKNGVSIHEGKIVATLSTSTYCYACDKDFFLPNKLRRHQTTKLCRARTRAFLEGQQSGVWVFVDVDDREMDRVGTGPPPGDTKSKQQRIKAAPHLRTVPKKGPSPPADDHRRPSQQKRIHRPQQQDLGWTAGYTKKQPEVPVPSPRVAAPPAAAPLSSSKPAPSSSAPPPAQETTSQQPSDPAVDTREEVTPSPSPGVPPAPATISPTPAPMSGARPPDDKQNDSSAPIVVSGSWSRRQLILDHIPGQVLIQPHDTETPELSSSEKLVKELDKRIVVAAEAGDDEAIALVLSDLAKLRSALMRLDRRANSALEWMRTAPGDIIS